MTTDSNPESDTTPVVQAETNGSDNSDDNNDSALKKRLLSRVAVAGVVILGLLGGLAVFDVLNKPQAPTLPKMATAPIEGADSQAKTGSINAGEKAAAETLAAEPKEEVAGVPERSDPTLAPLPAGKPLTPPATARQAAIKPAPAAAAHAKPDAAHEIARVVPERSASGHAAPAAAPARPLAQVAEGVKRFLVQVGVFSNHANAEELVAKLHDAGIPAQIESRVQVGPFASRAEADATRAKLKTLGIDDGLLVKR